MSSGLSEEEELALVMCLSRVDSYQHGDNDRTRTVVLMGATGNGKSTVGNVLAGESTFREGAYGVGQTQKVTESIVIVEYDQKTYTLRIIDTIGIGDGKLSREEVLFNLAEVCDFCKDGIHQIFFVTKGRFSAAEKEAWKVVQELIFEKDVVDYTTIVRTHVEPDDLANSVWMARDLELLCEGDDEVAGIFRRVGSEDRVLYVCNPNEQSRVHGWEELRQESREKLLGHLIRKCDRLYKPQQLDSVNDRVGADVEMFKLKEREVCELMEIRRRVEADVEAGKQQQQELERDLQKQAAAGEELRTGFEDLTEEVRESLKEHQRRLEEKLEEQRDENLRLMREVFSVTKKLEEAEKKKEEAKGSVLSTLKLVLAGAKYAATFYGIFSKLGGSAAVAEVAAGAVGACSLM